MKIESFELSRLRTEEAFGFHLLVLAELKYLPSETPIPDEPEEDEPVVQSTEPQEGSSAILTGTVTNYQTEVSDLDAALKTSNKLNSTAAKSAADKMRDNAWSVANFHLRGMELHPDAVKASTAVEVRELFLKYGNPVDLPQTEESGVFHNLIQDLLAVDSAKLESIFFSTWLDALQTTEAAFLEAAQASTAEEASRVVGAVKTALKAANDAYNKLVETVNAHVIFYGDVPYATFISHLNVLIANQKTILKARKTNAAKKKEEEEGTTPTPDDGTTPDTPTPDTPTPDTPPIPDDAPVIE